MLCKVIHPDGRVTDDTIHVPAGSGESYRQFNDKASSLVGGPPELVAVLFDNKHATLIVNEIGAVRDIAINPAGQLQPNARATAIYWTATIQGRTGVTFEPLVNPMIHGVALLLLIGKHDMSYRLDPD